MHLPRGTIEGPSQVRREFPLVRGEGLQGGACWTDYLMVSSERILIELLRDACRHGAVALNYAAVDDVVQERGVARGVRVRDSLNGATHLIAARAVVNCAGADLPKVAKGLGGGAEGLFRPSLAFNVLLDLAPSAMHWQCGPQADARSCSCCAHSLLAGTMHAAAEEA
jgi:glycerol-3-phosphate dehydrogenase